MPRKGWQDYRCKYSRCIENKSGRLNLNNQTDVIIKGKENISFTTELDGKSWRIRSSVCERQSFNNGWKFRRSRCRRQPLFFSRIWLKVNVAFKEETEENRISELELWHRRMRHFSAKDLISYNRVETVWGMSTRKDSQIGIPWKFDQVIEITWNYWFECLWSD